MIYILVCYDVNTQSNSGKRRLRRIAKACEKYGQRVQNSVFEVWCDYADFLRLKNKIISEMNEQQDSVRFYRLHKDYQDRVEHYGVKETYDPGNDVLII